VRCNVGRDRLFQRKPLAICFEACRSTEHMRVGYYYSLGALLMIDKARQWFSGQEDDDQTSEEFRLAWRGRRLRALQTPLAVALGDLLGLPGSEAVGISVVPFGFEDQLFYPLHGQCPLCAEETESELRRAICIHMRFKGRDNFCVPAWAHSACVEACAETEVEAGVPW
jgi:hypothetical protein